MFRACELVVVNKADLLPHIDFDLDKLLYNIDVVNPGVPGRWLTSARTGDGVAELRDWLGELARTAGRRFGMSATRAPVRRLVEHRLDQRRQAGERFFTLQAEPLAVLCHRMAERFARGGRLIAIGLSPAARSDVRHVAVEFVHPVIVGKRALPALGLCGESARLGRELALTAVADDIVIAFHGPADGAALPAAVAAARERGCLTIAFANDVGAEHTLQPPTEDPLIAQELVETAYHVLWELVHVFFEHRGLLEGRSERRSHDAGASSFLYPFLAEGEHDLDAILADVAARRS